VYGAEARQGMQHDDRHVAIREQCRHTITGNHACCVQPARRVVGPLVQFRKGPADITADQR